jgi:hypothetical protein
MPFQLPRYTPPDFSTPPLGTAPLATFRPVQCAGAAPPDYHATSIFPEYVKIAVGDWRLARESRMDCVLVRGDDGELKVLEFRHLRPGDLVACGRREDGEEGIFVHTDGFVQAEEALDKFSFRTRLSRETPFSVDYDHLYELLEHERAHGFLLWVCGPALAFDRDARQAFIRLIEAGYVHGILAGNGLATHDLEGALSGTALGQDIYSKRHVPLGHYRHLDAINLLRQAGSIEAALASGLITDGIVRAALSRSVPLVLAGSIRDDGPLPGVIGDVYEAQDRMRNLTRRATTVMALATQLHTIATGNLTPSFCVTAANEVRPVYFYSVDMSEFAVSKLLDRGSLTARAILTNVQDFLVTLERGLRARQG